MILILLMLFIVMSHTKIDYLKKCKFSDTWIWDLGLIMTMLLLVPVSIFFPASDWMYVSVLVGLGVSYVIGKRKIKKIDSFPTDEIQEGWLGRYIAMILFLVISYFIPVLIN